MLDSHLREQAVHALEENVNKISRLSEWPVYEHYEFIFDEAGNRYIHAPLWKDGEANNVVQRMRPLSRVSADLFLTFARWVEDPGMDKELDTKPNAQAAKQWAETFGVLGLNPDDISKVDMLHSRRVTADYLEMPGRGEVVKGRRNSAQGGQTEESVANFALEAWEAHIVWRLYKSVRKDTVHAPSIREFMSPFDHGERMPQANDHGQPVIARVPWVERDIYSRDPELTRRWALTIVEDAVNSKIAMNCFPIVQGAPGSYEQSWGFRTLLGAMWLQMMFLMSVDRRCLNCKSPLDPGMRSHAKFCRNDGKCRAAWHDQRKKARKRRRGGGSSAT